MNRLFYDALGGPSGTGGEGQEADADGFVYMYPNDKSRTNRELNALIPEHIRTSLTRCMGPGTSPQAIFEYVARYGEWVKGKSLSPGLRWVKASERLPDNIHNLTMRLVGTKRTWFGSLEIQLGKVVGPHGNIFSPQAVEYLDESPSLPGEQVADPISLYKASIGVSEPSAEKGEQVEGKGKDLSDFCQMLIDARQYKGLSIAEAEDGAHIPHGYLAHLEAGKYNQPSVHALYYLAKLYDIELKPLLVAGGVIVKRGQESSPPSVEADQQVPDEIKAWVQEQSQEQSKKLIAEEDYYNFPRVFAETAMIAIYRKMQEEVKDQKAKHTALVQEIATLKESFKSSVYQHDQNMQIVKGERNELRDLLNILNEGYSDHFTKFLNDRIYKALNKFTNKH